MPNLLLAGGCGAEASRAVDLRFVAALPASRSFIYVPVAFPPDRYAGCQEWIESVFLPLGVQRIEMWTELSGCTLDDLRAYGAVYFGGGSTERLLRSVTESGLRAPLQEFIEDGGVVYGGSAGAILLGRDIRSDPDAAHLPVDATKGLNQVGSYAVWCHYDPSAGEDVRQFVTASGAPAVAIPEQSTVHLTDGRTIEVIGSEPVTVFHRSGTNELQPGVIAWLE